MYFCRWLSETLQAAPPRTRACMFSHLDPTSPIAGKRRFLRLQRVRSRGRSALREEYVRRSGNALNRIGSACGILDCCNPADVAAVFNFIEEELQISRRDIVLCVPSVDSSVCLWLQSLLYCLQLRQVSRELSDIGLVSKGARQRHDSRQVELALRNCACGHLCEVVCLCACAVRWQAAHVCCFRQHPTTC